MVCTVGAAGRRGGRKAIAHSGAWFSVGLLAGSTFIFGSIGLVAMLLHPGRAWIIVASTVAVAAVLCDAAGLRVRPQISFQVPERWRRTMPLPLAVFLYGLLLGTGLTTYVPTAAAWALMLMSLAVAKLVPALAVGILLAVGRALPVLALAPRGDSAAPTGELETLVERPGALRVVRLLCAISLAAGAAALLGGAARASIGVAAAEDPSVASADLAWQRPGVGGFLRRQGAAAIQLPGNDPAIGGSLLAWHVGSLVTIAERATLAPVAQENVAGVQKLALSDHWLAFRRGLADGSSRLVVQSLPDLGAGETVASARWPATIGRPSLSGDLVVFHVATQRSSWISAVNLRTGKHRRLRTARHGQLLNPSILGSELLYVRVSRCSQQLRLGGLSGGSERVLLSLPALASEDLGHERGHTSQGGRVPCPGRPRPTTTTLWTTALTSRFAYVTSLRPARSGAMRPTLLQLPYS
jgi:hypothetical protein